ncbi:pollen-specific leucine-rich repeat extensin-like protein 3 [Iris pallida]|uniref:Pollen-specific leucine-rich repeat extensin-like protein 3 n=1 Tax=Iris pallida TaxID=29817 RepID=A0AAX6I833_IRIPA|nr:pollen-specific leucine-rich repeat extensin-like protein 3 [Iris pallida]
MARTGSKREDGAGNGSVQGWRGGARALKLARRGGTASGGVGESSGEGAEVGRRWVTRIRPSALLQKSCTLDWKQKWTAHRVGRWGLVAPPKRTTSRRRMSSPASSTSGAVGLAKGSGEARRGQRRERTEEAGGSDLIARSGGPGRAATDLNWVGQRPIEEAQSGS